MKTRFYQIICLIIFLFCFSANAQKQQQGEEHQKLKSILLESKKGWHRFKDGITLDAQHPEKFFEDHGEAFGLKEGSTMKLLSKVGEPSLKMNHYRFQEEFNGIPLVGSEYILHERQGHPLKGNGKIVRDFAKDSSPAISSEAALQAVLAQVNAKTYAWQSAEIEAIEKRQKKDSRASSYPQPKLVYYPTSDDSEDPVSYQLAYEMKVFALEPMSHKQYYVSAENGSVIATLELIHETNTPGTGNTIYNGTQNIITDFTGTDYVLKETNRAGIGTAISTYDMNNGFDYSQAANYQNSSTSWQNEPIGVQGHWAAEKTFDYYHNVHGRNSFNGNGGEIIGYHEFGVNFNNASWNGVFMTFGGGDGVANNSWSAIDIVGHEFTHGVTQTSAGLIYSKESGALNESFSDIFGTVVEFSNEDASNGDWLIGEDVTVNGTGIRSMANPNAFQDPDTYQANFWVFGSSDNGGVHTNSGVQNHWFYLLSEGGSGTNDYGNNFTVAGIGKDIAAAIAFRNLTVYLTPTSNYAGAREGSLSAAEDLFGRTSIEYAQTAMAWYAVGVGFPVYTGQDIALKSFSVSNCNQVTIQLLNLSTSEIIPAGAAIDVKITEDVNQLPIEHFVLSHDLLPGDEVTKVLTQTISSTGVQKTIQTQLIYFPDPEFRNNSIVRNFYFLNGTLKIGGANPDFLTINQALGVLRDQNNIRCGDVSFKIASGQYDDEINLTNIHAPSGGSITFESESGNPNDVILYSSTPVGSNSGTINISNVTGVRLKNVTIVREVPASIPVATALSIRGSISDLILEGNKLKIFGTTGQVRQNILIGSDGQAQEDITIKNNILEQGDYGITGLDSQSLNNNILIENNRFINHRFGVWNLRGITLTFRGNKVSSTRGEIGISLGATHLLVENNELNLSGAGSAGALAGIIVQANPSSRAKIFNNIININSSQSSLGINIGDIYRSEILHNTIRQTKTTAGSASATSISFASTSSEKVIENNIIFNSVIGGRGIDLTSGPSNFIDFNDLYVPNGNVGRLDFVAYQTLIDWYSHSGYDVNSVSLQPPFISTSDIRLASAQSNLIGAATGIQYDIDGEVRGASPYMGADEFIPVSFLSLSPSTILNVPASGDSYKVAVKGSPSWQIQMPLPAGITVNPNTAGSFIVTVDPNSSFLDREFLLTVATVDRKAMRTLFLQQDGDVPSLIASPETITISPAGAIGSVSVISNTSWVIASASSGMSISDITGSGFTYTVFQNNQSTSKVFTITLQTTGAPKVTKTVTLNQAGFVNISITLTPSTVDNIPSEGGTGSIAVDSNVPWEFSSLPLGVTASDVTTTGFTYTVAPNPLGDPRTLFVFVASTTMTEFRQLTLNQLGTTSILPSEYLEVYPNPVENNKLVLHGMPDVQGTYHIVILDLYGVHWMEQQLLLEQKQVLTSEINVNILPSGIYLVQVTDPSGKIKTIRFEKK